MLVCADYIYEGRWVEIWIVSVPRGWEGVGIRGLIFIQEIGF